MSEVTLSLRDRVAAVRANTISEGSRRSYRASWSRFLNWLRDNKPDLVSDELAVQVQSYEEAGNATRKAILKAIDADKERAIAPIRYSRIRADDFLEWLLSLEGRGGEPLGFSSYNNHRAALFNLFREYRQVMSAELQADMTTCFRGLKRSVAQQASRGDIPVKVGKDPLSFELYEYLCLQLLKSTSVEAAFAHSFLVMTWNLMCRSSNTVGIKTSHVEWRGDSLCVYFAHMKNDQTGARPRDPRHVYANPLRPAICPVLTLGVYWALNAVDPEQLFPGSSQYDRFRKQLRALLEDEEVVTELRRRGVSPQDLGIHSIRKGSATYCTSGSTSCPTTTAVHLRAGWSMGGVQNTYLRYQGAGDKQVGRTVSGLPTNSKLFAVLPPHFAAGDDVVRAGVQAIFGIVPLNLQFVSEHALASLIHHHDYLLAILGATHPLFRCPLYQDTNLLQQLRDRVLVGVGKDQSQRATGIPPHCAMLEKLQSLVEAVHRVDVTMVDRVREVISASSAINSSTIRDAVVASLEAYGLPALLNRLHH